MSDNTVALSAPVPAALAKAAAECILAEDGRRQLTTAYQPHFAQFAALKEDAAKIQDDQPKAARELRLKLKAVRVEAEKTRKALKEDSLRRGKAIDGICNVLEYELVPVEKAMEAIEKAEEIREAARKEALKQQRTEALAEFVDPSFYNLGEMPEAQFQDLLASSKTAHTAKIEAAKRAEEERIAAEERAEEERIQREAEEKAERERMRAENERLAKIAAEERAAREEAERKAAVERAEQEKREKAAAEARAAELAEAARKQKAAEDEAARQAEKYRKEKDAMDARIQAQKDAEAARIKAEEEAERKAKAAPDREKLTALAKRIRYTEIPTLTSDALRAKIVEQCAKMAAWIEAEAGKL